MMIKLEKVAIERLNYKSFIIIIALTIAILIFSLNFIVVFIDGESMAPTLSDNNIKLFKRVDRALANGDVVLIKSDENSLVKRIVASPGDKISVKENNLYINNMYVADCLNCESVEYLVDNGYCFVLGDNVNNSIDSRYFGPIKYDQIIGYMEN